MVAPLDRPRTAALVNGSILWNEIQEPVFSPGLPRPDELSLLDMMDDLSRILRTYFHLEESDDHVAIVELSPHLHRRVALLQAEHRELLASLDQRLAETTRDSEEQCTPNDCRRVFAWFEAFEQKLLKHEVRERDLLNAAYLDDLGTGD